MGDAENPGNILDEESHREFEEPQERGGEKQ